MHVPKKPILLLLSTAFFLVAHAQTFMTREGHAHFFSSTSIENIEADNQQLSGLLDASTGDFAFQVQMRSFHFEKALMEEHFNESYVESEKYPKASFQGSIESWESVKPNGESFDVVAIGDFDIHGIAKTYRIEGRMKYDNSIWHLNADFEVTLADHNIQIPPVVRDNISPVIAIDVDAQMMPR